MRNLEQLALVVELACLTEDRTELEQQAMLAVAKRIDAEANRQTTGNVILRDQPWRHCTFKPGPPSTHGKCKCSPPPGSHKRMKVREPRSGWWRYEQMVLASRGPGDDEWTRPAAIEDVVVTV